MSFMQSPHSWDKTNGFTLFFEFFQVVFNVLYPFENKHSDGGLTVLLGESLWLFGFLLVYLHSDSVSHWHLFTHQTKSNNIMEKKRILIVTQEMDPYLALTEASK